MKYPTRYCLNRAFEASMDKHALISEIYIYMECKIITYFFFFRNSEIH